MLILTVYLWWLERGLEVLVMYHQVMRISATKQKQGHSANSSTEHDSVDQGQVLHDIVLGEDGVSSASFVAVHEMMTSIYLHSDRDREGEQRRKDWLTSSLSAEDASVIAAMNLLKRWSEDKVRIEQSLQQATSRWQEEQVQAELDGERDRMMTLSQAVSVPVVSEDNVSLKLYELVGMKL